MCEYVCGGCINLDLENATVGKKKVSELNDLIRRKNNNKGLKVKAAKYYHVSVTAQFRWLFS